MTPFTTAERNRARAALDNNPQHGDFCTRVDALRREFTDFTTDDLTRLMLSAEFRCGME